MFSYLTCLDASVNSEAVWHQYLRINEAIICVLTTTDCLNPEFQPPNSTISKISLSEVENIEDIGNLAVKQLKIILTNNFVDYHGCKEKHELVTKVKMLWESRQANQRLYEKLISQTGMCDSM